MSREQVSGIARVICCNDAVMYVVLGHEEDADKFMEHMAEQDFRKNEAHWISSCNDFYPNGTMTPYEHYRKMMHWHVKTVAYTAFSDYCGVMAI